MKKILLLPLIACLFSFGFQDHPLFTGNTEKLSAVVSPENESDISASSNFKVSGRQVKLNGDPIFFKGMGYQPVPVGQHPNDAPNGDYFTSNYAHIYKPDVDKMRAMGVNAIKIYSWYPDKDHSDFLNYCYNNNNDPIFVAVGYFMPPGTIVNNFEEKLALFKTLASKTATHPAIIGYMLGNENVGGDINNPVFWTNLNKISAAIKAIAPNKLTFTGLVDDGMKSVRAGNSYMTSLDVWGINVFRGKTLGDFYKTYENASTKPVFVTELGFPATIRTNGVPAVMPDNAEDVADYTEDVLKEIEKNSSDDDASDVVAGVFWFMFCDEWWKQECPACWSPNNQPCACSKSTHDFTKTNYTDNFPGKWWDEEWFGLYTTDRSPRAAVKTITKLWK